MEEQPIIPLQRISVFMPHRLTDVEMRLLFIARKPLFERIIQRISQEKPNSIPQHHLIVGVRGMGKTMLLRRLAVELSDEQNQKRFVALSFPEEQYNIDRLSKFWLNALDGLANTLQKEGDEVTASELDKEIAQLETIKIEEQKSTESYNLLIERCKKLERRPVFLLDNLNLIFDRLAEEEHSKIRAIITSNDAPIFVGASADLVNEDYQAPFYDAFDVEYLSKLDFKQTLSLIQYLADVTGQTDFKNHLYSNLARLEALHQLTGGNVRTLILLFRLVVKDFTASDIYQDLEALVDDMTPIYKSQFEEFSPQTQLVLDAIALVWDPCNLDAIREFTNLETGKISAHLDRLQKAGWIQKLGSRKKSTYEISERFFNIWYLMRRGTRRQGRDLQWLTSFLQNWFNKKELRQILDSQIGNLNKLSENELAYCLPMSRALGKTKTGQEYQQKFYKRLIELFDGDEQKVKDCMGVKPEEINEKWFVEHKIEKSNKWELQALLQLGEGILEFNIGENEKAEKSFLKALTYGFLEDYIYLYLGMLYKKNAKYRESKDAFEKSIKINKNYSIPRILLGNLLYQMGQIDESEKNFKVAIKLKPGPDFGYIALGDLYFKKGQYEKAIEFYGKIKEMILYKSNSQIFIYRDKLKMIEKAFQIFEKAEKLFQIENIVDVSYLHKALFNLYNQNQVLSNNNWKKALNEIKIELPSISQDDWQHSAAVAVKLGYGKNLLEIFKETGHDRKLRPFYEAIKALNLNDEDYLRTQVAAEVREVALTMYTYMKKYNEN